MNIDARLKKLEDAAGVTGLLPIPEELFIELVPGMSAVEADPTLKPREHDIVVCGKGYSRRLKPEEAREYREGKRTLPFGGPSEPL